MQQNQRGNGQSSSMTTGTVTRREDRNLSDATMQMQGLNLGSSEGGYEFTPALNRAAERKRLYSDEEIGFLSLDAKIVGKLVKVLKSSMQAVSSDSLYDWQEKHFQTAVLVTAATKYFQKELNDAYSENGKETGGKYGKIKVFVSEEDPIWVPFNTHSSKYDPSQNYVRDTSSNGYYIYNDVTLYVYATGTKEMLVIQLELKYLNMGYVLTRNNGNPLDNSSKRTGKTPSKEDTRVRSEEFVNYFNRNLDLGLGGMPLESVPIFTYVKSESKTDKNPPKRLDTNVKKFAAMQKEQCAKRTLYKYQMCAEEMENNEEIRSAKIANYLLLGCVNRVLVYKNEERSIKGSYRGR